MKDFPKLETIVIAGVIIDPMKLVDKIVISNSGELKSLNKNKPQKTSLKELVFGENACDDVIGHCELSNLSNLEEMTVKKGSFISLNSLRIVDNPKLKKIIIEDGTDASNGPFYKLNSLTISSNCNFKLYYF